MGHLVHDSNTSNFDNPMTAPRRAVHLCEKAVLLAFTFLELR